MGAILVSECPHLNACSTNKQDAHTQAQLLDKHGVELSGWALSLLARVDVVVEQRKPLHVERVDLEGRNWLQPEALSGRLQGIANGVPRAQDLVILDECVPPGMALLQQAWQVPPIGFQITLRPLPLLK
jgi:hypothetical protein